MNNSMLYWINAKSNPPKNNERIIGLDRYNMVHKMIFINGDYLFDCKYPYAANPIVYPIWWIPAPMFSEGENNDSI